MVRRETQGRQGKDATGKVFYGPGGCKARSGSSVLGPQQSLGAALGRSFGLTQPTSMTHTLGGRAQDLAY